MSGNSEPVDGNYRPVDPIVVAGTGYVVPQGSGSIGTDTVTGQQYAPGLLQLANKNFAIAAGTIVDLDMPFANGLTVSQASGSAAATLSLI